MRKRKIISMILVFSMVFGLITISPVFTTEAKADYENELEYHAEKNNTYAFIGGTAKLNVVQDEAKSSIINYQWYKVNLNESDIIDPSYCYGGPNYSHILTEERLNTEVKLQNKTNQFLYLNNISDSDYGDYACEITDGSNRVVIVCSLKKIEVGDEVFNSQMSNIIRYNHLFGHSVKGVVDMVNEWDPDGKLNRDSVDIATTLKYVLPKNEYKFIWLINTYSGPYGLDEWELPVLSDECIDKYVESNHEDITLLNNDEEFWYADLAGRSLRCFAIPKDKYYNNDEINTAIEAVKNSSDKRNAIKALREVEKNMATKKFRENSEVPLTFEERLEHPIGFEYSEYLDYIDFLLDEESYIVQAKLGDRLTLYGNDFNTTCPVEYNWYNNSTEYANVKELVIDSLNLQDSGTIRVSAILRCPYETSCSHKDSSVSKHVRSEYMILNPFDLSVTGDISNNGSDIVNLNVYAEASSPFRIYNWYKRKNGMDTELSGDTSTLEVNNPEKYTGKNSSESVSYICKVSDGFNQEEVIFNIRDSKKFEVSVDNHKVDTNGVFKYYGNKGTNLLLNPSVTLVDDSENVEYTWYKNGVELSTTDSSVEATYPEEGANTYEVRIKNSTDSNDVNTVTIKYVLRSNWENNMIYTTKDLTDNSSSGGSGSAGGSSGGSSSGGGSGSSGGGSSSGDTSSEDKKTEDSKDETTKDDENKEEIKDNDKTEPSKDVVQSQPSQTAEKQVVKETEQLIKDIGEGKISDKVISEETANNIKEAIKEGKEIVTDIVSQSIKKEEITQSVVTKITNVVKKLSTKAKIAEYLNLEVQLRAEDKVLGNVNELTKPIDFTISIPDNMKAANRKYFVLRMHNGVVEKLDTVVNKDGTLTFKTDKFSTYALAYEDVTKLAKVNSLKAVTSTKTVKLTWDKVKDATGYRVFIAKNGKWIKLADTVSNSFVSNKFVAGTSLKFAVRAYYKSDISLSWADKYTSINTCTKPSKVAGFTSKSIYKTSVATTWKKTSGATGYRMYISKNGKWIQVATTKTNKYTFKGLKKNTKYKFAVRAYKTVGNKTVLSDSYTNLSIKTKK